jgi:tetratricopeptide (TPR) repeat protein
MIEHGRLLKVEILIQQKKFFEAEKILKDLLYADPNNVDLLSLYAELNLQQDKLDAARSIIDNAIGLSPSSAHLFYIKSRISIMEDDYNEAEKNIHQSIELDPYDADYFAFWANIKLLRKQFDSALELANKALEIDAENISGLNARSAALVKLDKGEEAFKTIEGALRGDPNNAYTHANYGWGLLEKRQHQKALEHFQEALKNDPNLDYAQAGLLEALKATNPVYRLYLRYSFWMHNLTANNQWTFIIGFYIISKVLSALAKNNEALRPFLTPITIALSIVAFSTWIIMPIGNLFLRFNKYGQLLLDREERLSSNFVAASFGVFLLGIVFYLAFKNEDFLSVAAFGFTMMLPYGTMFLHSKHNNAMLIYTALMTLAGIIAIGITFATHDLVNLMSMVFLIGLMGYQWVSNYLSIERSNK